MRDGALPELQLTQVLGWMNPGFARVPCAA